ncbi:hypothetical protein R75461_08486 [Paraburkholderia nemoris]|nr:hypothetical protein R75461_08486 [Paraburkholderia nemoris]
MQRHQPAGRIVDIHQQRALRRPFLEPRMLAAVDLHQLAQTRAPGPRLVDLRRALPAWYPQTGIRHQMPHGFLRQCDPVAFVQLLAGERRSEIGVALADQRQGLRTQIDGQLMIARAATSA